MAVTSSTRSGRSGQGALGFVVEIWSRDDLPAAGEWLRGQEPSNSRDQAMNHFATGLVSEDPALAAEWADAIQSEPLRDRTRETLYARWVEKDSEAAADWKDGWE